ncbi:RHS repeat-associated core domain-containing protein [Pseudomonas rustica]|uniref:RHS repeat-associated core domain-containing protein n=1 Tax=Pseudomonas rustica TaxID=2827099 RepID=UPI0020163675|nr:RHS repeat-associated core domain-containing protein [Pseudomonas rustica]
MRISPATRMSVDSLTPNCTAIDSRGMVVRQIAYWQQDLSKHEARKTVQQRDAAGRLTAQQDPRLMTDPAAPANLVSTYSLSGKALSTVSVDAGWRVDLFGAAGQLMWGCDARGSQRQAGYDNLLRPIAVFEQASDNALLCTERYEYGWADSAFSERNQCGQLIRHDESAGVLLFEQFGLAGEVLMLTRHYLLALEVPDWPEPVPEREALLEPGTEATSRSQFNALSEVIEQTDARGNRQFFSQTLAGQLREVRLQLAKGVAPKVLVSAIQYNALGQMVRETAGNSVITSLEYAAQNGRLTRLQAKRGNDALQDLRYDYDPVGNVLSIEDAALPVRYFANQRVEPVNRYVYNSLYQLIKATGWEAGGSDQGPAFSRFDDPASCANYSQTYRYDHGGNLLELTHDGPQSHSHRLVAAAQSNRCLPVINGVEPSEEDLRKSFDANGNLLNLQPGQVFRWDLRNQLREVSPVANDRERYVYGADGMRVRKVRSTQTNARTLVSEVRYLPGLELRTHSGTGEALQVITVQAGRSSVRVLHWESEPPKDIANDQYRYSLNDHLGSCALELDSSGDIISQERYHPFGTTAWFAGRGEVEASYKTVRYSGQERDATGLYYYGFRYYAPWLQRWLNPDPAGTVDGLNIYSFVKNNPSSGYDDQGLVYRGTNDRIEKLYTKKKNGYHFKYRGNTDTLTAQHTELSHMFNSAITLFSQLLKETTDELESGNTETFRRYLMGYKARQTSENKTIRIIEKYKTNYNAVLKEMPRYQQSGDLYDQVAYIQNKRENLHDHIAFMHGNDPYQRIFIRGAKFRNLNVLGQARVVGHELFHIFLKKADFFYYPLELSSKQSENDVSKAIKGLATVVDHTHVQHKTVFNVIRSFESEQLDNADTFAVYPIYRLKESQIKNALRQTAISP